MKINLAILAPIFFLCCNASDKKFHKGFRYYMPKEKMSKNCEYIVVSSNVLSIHIRRLFFNNNCYHTVCKEIEVINNGARQEFSGHHKLKENVQKFGGSSYYEQTNHSPSIFFQCSGYHRYGQWVFHYRFDNKTMFKDSCYGHIHSSK